MTHRAFLPSCGCYLLPQATLPPPNLFLTTTFSFFFVLGLSTSFPGRQFVLSCTDTYPNPPAIRHGPINTFSRQSCLGLLVSLVAFATDSLALAPTTLNCHCVFNGPSPFLDLRLAEGTVGTYRVGLCPPNLVSLLCYFTVPDLCLSFFIYKI